MASKHAARHTQKTAIRFVPIVAVIVAAAVLICIVVAKRPSQEDRAVEDKPILEVLQDDTSSDDGEAKDSDAISTWINRLNDEQKAELDIAYEASVKDGYKGSLDEWVATEVQAHLNDSGNVVVVLPDGGCGLDIGCGSGGYRCCANM
jgi:Na+-translocating ferredoxin:NAD+ oxidoreductase RnfG subunit